MKLRDLTGERHGKLVVIKRVKNRGRRIHWLCKCDCGKEKEAESQALIVGDTKSCGCLPKRLRGTPNGLERGEANFNVLFGAYRHNAAKKKREFGLLKEDFKKIVTSNCYYCGDPPKRVISQLRTFGEFIYNGIDRVDNRIGYILNNCVPCCTTCNKAKLTMSKEEFLLWIKRVYDYQNRSQQDSSKEVEDKNAGSG